MEYYLHIFSIQFNSSIATSLTILHICVNWMRKEFMIRSKCPHVVYLKFLFKLSSLQPFPFHWIQFSFWKQTIPNHDLTFWNEQENKTFVFRMIEFCFSCSLSIHSPNANSRIWNRKRCAECEILRRTWMLSHFFDRTIFWNWKHGFVPIKRNLLISWTRKCHRKPINLCSTEIEH